MAKPWLLVSVGLLLALLSLCRAIAGGAPSPVETAPATATSPAQPIAPSTATPPRPPTSTSEPPTPTPPPPTSPPAPRLDLQDSRSVLAWIVQALERGEASAFAEFISEEGLLYANYLEGGQIRTREQFLADLEARFPSRPRCLGVYLQSDSLQIWTDDWSPPWVMEEVCYQECSQLDPPWQSRSLGFLLFPRKGLWNLKAIYLNPPERYYYTPDVQLLSCKGPFPP